MMSTQVVEQHDIRRVSGRWEKCKRTGITPLSLWKVSRKGGGERGAVAQAAAATAGEATVGAVLCSGLRSRTAVEKFIVGHAGVSGGADEDALVHVGCALGTNNAHGMTAHIDLARDINDTHRAHGIFTPGVGDLAIGRDRVRVDC
jgi:hypothetical protein